jgi:uncharacterized protein (TIGR02246 family)
MWRAGSAGSLPRPASLARARKVASGRSTGVSHGEGLVPRLLLASVCAVAACTARPSSEAERAAILKADSAWLRAVAARNIDSALSFWTADGRVIGPGQPAVVGREALRAMLAVTFATPHTTVTWSTKDVVVSPSGDMAYSLGPNLLVMPDPTGHPDSLRGQLVVVWRKGADGRWRAAIHATTPAPG